ncbi:MAG TPA: SAM-dependent methyltransferase [Allosphingosinicella sp.]|nr:SAM-dependent methyltransferase [Allosphingosinicella sp.]
MKPPADQDVAGRIRQRIEVQGPIAVAEYMAMANAHYYAHHDVIGVAGDFTTAPEISQMFGELIGIWLADLWVRAGRPARVHYVELGPGRGTLARDALRAMAGAGLCPQAELVETSARMRSRQAEAVPDARWHDQLATLPDDGPLLVVANEFFDALPVRQFDSSGRELRVTWEGGRFVREGVVHQESSPESLDIVRVLAQRLVAQGGAALIVDYGHSRPGTGDTLQAVSRHVYADPWQEPGGRDLTAHVDFHALATAARSAGAIVHGPVPQGAWLEAMGIRVRAAALAKASQERAEEIAAARGRLTDADQMGRLFKVLALTAPGWPDPAGFR